jgi:hypothetical protein
MAANPAALLDLSLKSTRWRKAVGSLSVRAVFGNAPAKYVRSASPGPHYPAAGELPPGVAARAAALLGAMGLTMGDWRGMKGPARYEKAWARRRELAALGAETARQAVSAIDAGVPGLCTFKQGDATFYGVDMGEPVFHPPLRVPSAVPQPGVTVHDPIQGAVDDCATIASMASLAWAWPWALRGRFSVAPGGVVKYDFARAGGAAAAAQSAYASVPTLLCATPGEDGYLYFGAHGPADGPCWPAVLETLAAQRNTGALVGCVDVRGVVPTWLTDLVPGGYVQSGRGEAAAVAFLRAYCPGGRAAIPMTVGTGQDVDGAESMGVVPSHAYSVLGTVDTAEGVYAVLRNPWGWHGSRGPTTLRGVREWFGLTVGELPADVRQAGSGMGTIDSGPTWNPIFALHSTRFARVFRDGIIGVAAATPARRA